jgi:hypothetical protein
MPLAHLTLLAVVAWDAAHRLTCREEGKGIAIAARDPEHRHIAVRLRRDLTTGTAPVTPDVS